LVVLDELHATDAFGERRHSEGLGEIATLVLMLLRENLQRACDIERAKIHPNSLDMLA
jgi:hypothetical protein